MFIGIKHDRFSASRKHAGGFEHGRKARDGELGLYEG
jgi:hypothetical protein